MRAGACAVQQTLTAEAASALKHSLGLARRRGHAQVTPLHVAATLLGARASSLRRACLKSQPPHHSSSHHPLQCRALELCFNVALNRLPTAPSPLLHSSQPSLSNALIAALKRAQAHQRRGCIEQQQQQQPPLLAIKVELEQLIVSILDDPSVSRVMREAGFSSTAVKNNLEDSSASSVFHCYTTSSSGGVFSSPCSPSPSPGETHHRDLFSSAGFWPTHFLNYSHEKNPVLFSPQKRHPVVADSASREDLKLVLEVLLRKKRRNTVIVGDSLCVTEGLVSELMGKVESREVPEELRSAHFVKFQFSPVSLRFMKKEEVEAYLSDLKRKVDSLVSGEGGVGGGGGGGAIIYLGDLKWTVKANSSEKDGVLFSYSAVDHLVSEIGRLVSDYSSSSRKVWLMATASYQTYMKCQMRQPPLEIQWALQAVSVPSGGLGLSLHSSSINDSRIFPENTSPLAEIDPFIPKEDQNKLNCCAECTSNYEKEVGFFKSGHQKPLPLFLQPHSTEAHQKDDFLELRRKWSTICCSLHSRRPSGRNHLSASLSHNQSLTGKSNSYTSPYPWWTNTQSSIFPEPHSISFNEPASKVINHNTSALPRFRRQKSCHIEFSFSQGAQKSEVVEPRLDSLRNTPGKEVKITLALGNSQFSNLGKVSEREREGSLKEGDIICKVIKENVPWQSEAIPFMVGTLMENKYMKKETWLLIQGNDTIGKRRAAHSIAESVLGSADLLLHLDMRKRDNGANLYSGILAKALTSHEKLLVLVENVDFASADFIKLLADSFESGKSGESDRRGKTNCQAIYILTTGDHEDVKSVVPSVVPMKLQVNESTSTSGTPNFDHKRKAEWDSSNKIKGPRIDEKENSENEKFRRQASSNSLDLNIRADEDEEKEESPGEFSPISSDLTRETAIDSRNPTGFLELIENRCVFDRNPARDTQITGFFLSKLKGAFGEVHGGGNIDWFGVEHMVLEEIVLGSGSLLNSLFEKWLKEVFQTSLQTVQIGGKEGILVRLCFGGREERDLDEGFMGSSLPRKIQISSMD